MFCPKCKSIMLPKKVGEKTILQCGCGYTSEKGEAPRLTDSLKKGKELAVVDKEIETLPLTDEECPKCGHDKAYFWTAQTRSADEPDTKFMRCEKCKHQWRDYS